ncbi:response regulator [Pseudodesulfovibrio sp. JC047]|uniref:sigma-54-dependent transcriptional regulator n=1 Tax=Pseudodesulfovibrio sp. JC047 TaxID=2683199 RepID=UPI0013D6715C|nr:sigma-54 dependent transcriptional regulator [Pseudodesulfovibrio sp. JC047]NDV19697.1 response regulator [Pseudodesulfovibrio sp. JC047]
MYTPHVLIVDDESASIDSFELILMAGGVANITRCDDGRQVMSLLDERPYDLMLLDLVMPHVTGEELLEQIKETYPNVEVVIITGIDTVDSAVNCMRLGAFDYLVKPVDETRLMSTVTRALEMRRLKRENSSLRSGFLSDALDHPDAFAAMITRDARMLRMFRYVEAVAGSGQPVLITGESGTGKELLARALHTLTSAENPFVPVNVAGVDDTVFSDTLFGHIKGAFTGAQGARAGLVDQASGGCLFLDEIGDLSAASQVKLLRLIQEREYLPLGADLPKPAEARVIAATHCDLEAARDDGRFRADLYYRLCIHHVHIPPLRERPDDLPVLMEHFVRKASTMLDREPPSIPDRLIRGLATYAFPGNVRELESMIFDAVSNCSGDVLPLASFRERISTENGSPRADMDLSDCMVFPDPLPTLAQASDMVVEEAMRRSGGKQTAAARLLGISQPALSKRLKRMAATDR